MRQRGVLRDGVAVAVVGQLRDVAIAVGHALGLAVAIHHGGDDDPFGGGQRGAAGLVVVAQAGGVAEGVGAGDGTGEGVIAGALRSAGGVDDLHGAAEAVVLSRVDVAVGVGAADDAAEGVVLLAGGGGQIEGVARFGQQQAAGVEAAAGLDGAGVGVDRGGDSIAEAVVTLAGMDAERVGAVDLAAGAIVDEGGAGICAHVGQRLDGGIDRCTGQPALQRRQRGGVKPGRIARDAGFLAQAVVAMGFDFAQRIDCIDHLAVGVVEEQRAMAVGVGAAGQPTGGVVGIAGSVGLPYRCD